MVQLTANKRISRLRMMAGVGCAALAIAASPMGAIAQSAVARFDIRPAPLSQSMLEFGRQAGISISADRALTSGLQGRPVSGSMPVEQALEQLLEGTGLTAQFYGPTTVRLVRSGQGDDVGNDLQANGSQDVTAVADIIVTAQKREQSIQDVPIAVSAFSADTLDAMKIEGGSELLRAIPNVAFSKSNFSMYNFSIRGIGTKAVSSSSDPAVAVSFNNAPMIRNRLFEAEYLDVSRVEVLRGPQGTLYGRNATAGVVNMIPNRPQPDFDAQLKAEIGNFGTTRGQMMINVPLTDTFWVRGAASMTKREGFDHNTFLDTRVNDRDLHSYRLSAAWEPTDRFSADFIWERFEEDDSRSRTGKQLCTRDPGLTNIGAADLNNFSDSSPILQARFSQGCLPGSLYSDDAYQTPNGLAMATSIVLAESMSIGLKNTSTGSPVVYVMDKVDPYLGVVQSKNLREISSSYDPKFRATNDIFQLNLKYNLNDRITFNSQTLFTRDDYWSTQDYARYASNIVFNDSDSTYYTDGSPVDPSTITPGGYYNDPQLGISNRIMSADISQSKNSQFYQEFRLQSDNNENFNFSLGINYLKFKTEDYYYVFNNTFTMIAEYLYNSDNSFYRDKRTIDCKDASTIECVYVDRSSINNLAGDGHNYFVSKNVLSTESSAVFGEAYINLSENVKLTLGARYTNDEKITTPYPSQLLLGYSDISGGFATGGKVARGLVAYPDIKQRWEAGTGRIVLDWQPTDAAMLYASVSRGYKGGGTNPPRADIDPSVIQYQPLAETFDPEYVIAYELGSKLSFQDGRISFNATAFHYDYEDYQVSQIVDRISLNENFNATSTGLELEAVWRPNNNFRLDANIGYLKTRIADGEKSIDVMNRTQGNEDWVVVRPWLQVPSNCIAPKKFVEDVLTHPFSSFWMYATSAMCGGSARMGSFNDSIETFLPLYALFQMTYDPLKDAPNGGRGFDADLSGNELPNAPRWTANIGAQYTWFIGNSELTLRGDYYRQADSYFRVYNTEYDKIRGWDNLNLAVTWDMPQQNMTVQAYVKNVFDDAPIVDAFTNSDDSMLTTNVFTLDPRIWGISLTKRF